MQSINVTETLNWDGVLALAQTEIVQLDIKEAPPLIAMSVGEYQALCAIEDSSPLGRARPGADRHEDPEPGAPRTDYQELLAEIGRLERRAEEYVLSTPSDPARVTEVFTRACEVFERPDGAIDWLSQRNWALGHVRPSQLLLTSEGARQVLNVLGQIEHGLPV